MQNNLLNIGIIAIILLLTGCSTKIVLSEYKSIQIEKSQFAPSPEDMESGNTPKVIIMDIDNSGIYLAKNAKLGGSIASTVSSLLAKGKSVSLVKRATNITLSSEIEAAQLSKELGVDVGGVDYVISGQISNATYNHTFTKSYVTRNKDGSYNRHSARMAYRSCVSGNVKIVSLPDLIEEESFEYNECVNKSTQVRSSRDVVRYDFGFVRSAGQRGADTISYDLKNFFAKKGYIYEMKTNDGDKIAKVTLGSKDGAKENDEVIIYSVVESTNSLSGKTTKEVIKIGEATISDKITKTSAWIIIDKIEEERKIKAGDFIKINYLEGFMSKGMKALF